MPAKKLQADGYTPITKGAFAHGGKPHGTRISRASGPLIKHAQDSADAFAGRKHKQCCRLDYNLIQVGKK